MRPSLNVLLLLLLAPPALAGEGKGTDELDERSRAALRALDARLERRWLRNQFPKEHAPTTPKTHARGTITSAGRPVVGTNVQFVRLDEAGSSRSGFGDSTQTDAHGRFKVALHEGTYSLTVGKGRPRKVVVRAGSPGTKLDLPSWNLRVRVVDSLGRPLQGATVSVSGDGRKWISSGSFGPRPPGTNRQGEISRFHLGALPIHIRVAYGYVSGYRVLKTQREIAKTVQVAVDPFGSLRVIGVPPPGEVVSVYAKVRRQDGFASMSTAPATFHLPPGTWRASVGRRGFSSDAPNKPEEKLIVIRAGVETTVRIPVK